jgi:hypothetical protein
MFLIKKLTFDRMNFHKLSVHVFCLAEKAKLRRTNRKNCQQNKITVCRGTPPKHVNFRARWVAPPKLAHNTNDYQHQVLGDLGYL